MNSRPAGKAAARKGPTVKAPAKSAATPARKATAAGGMGSRTGTATAPSKSTSKTIARKTTAGAASGKSTGKVASAPSTTTAGKATSASDAKGQRAASAQKTPVKRAARPGGKDGNQPSGGGEGGSNGGDADSGSDGHAAPKHITAQEAMENTRELLAARQAKARTPPAWQEHDTSGHGKVAKSGFESGSARDRAVELHQDEMRLQANEGSISDRDRHQQGRRDSR